MGDWEPDPIAPQGGGAAYSPQENSENSFPEEKSNLPKMETALLTSSSNLMLAAANGGGRILMDKFYRNEDLKTRQFKAAGLQAGSAFLASTVGRQIIPYMGSMSETAAQYETTIITPIACGGLYVLGDMILEIDLKSKSKMEQFLESVGICAICSYLLTPVNEQLDFPLN